MTEGKDTDGRIALAFRLAMAREPRLEEVTVLKRIYDAQLRTYQKDASAAESLLKIGESPRNTNLDIPELAAWTSIASVILNLDETITKG
jgi:hypothetical protein